MTSQQSGSPCSRQDSRHALPMAMALAAAPGAADPGSLAPWWQRFNDPLLGTLVTQALQANTSIRSAQAAL